MDSLGMLATAATDRLAAQWIALGGQLVGTADRTPVDLEALIAMTAGLTDLDTRIRGVSIDWVVEYGQVVHAGRLRRVADELGVERQALARYGGTVQSAGGPKWPFAELGVPGQSRSKVVARDLSHPARIMWRVRAAFGVSARSGVLTVLLITPRVPTSIASLATRTRFTKVAVANAVAGMSLSGILTKDRVGNEDRITLDQDSPLRELMELDGVPDIDWANRWRVIFQVLTATKAVSNATPAARLVETRTLTEALMPFLASAGLPRPDLTAFGADWTDAFDEWLKALALRLDSMGA